jgi:hypothetical protein
MKPTAPATALPFLKGAIILTCSAMIATGCVMLPLAIVNDTLTLISAAVFGALMYVGLYLFDRPVRPLAVLLALLPIVSITVFYITQNENELVDYLFVALIWTGALGGGVVAWMLTHGVVGYFGRQNSDPL